MQFGRYRFVTVLSFFQYFSPGDSKTPKTAQPSANPPDLRLPPTIEPKINVTRNPTYLNPA